jgi:hypothetical protein
MPGCPEPENLFRRGDAETRRKTRRGKNGKIKSKPESAEEAENREKAKGIGKLEAFQDDCR